MIKKRIIKANIYLFFGLLPIALNAKSIQSKSSKSKLKEESSYSENYMDQDEEYSIRKYLDNPAINPEDIISQKSIWLELHLEERVNTPFFTSGREISKYIISGVLSGVITPYRDEKCTIPMSIDDFLKNIRDPNLSLIDEESEFNSGSSKNLINKKDFNNDSVPTEEERFRPKDLSILVLKTRIITDIIRSIQRLVVDSITLRIPAKKFINGIQKDVASFKYEELQSYFDTLDQDKCWIDPENEMNNMTFSNAFRKLSLWFPQSYMVLTERMKIYGQEPDPSKPLDLRKSDIITEEAHLWVY